jgi:hypothetical protein
MDPSKLGEVQRKLAKARSYTRQVYTLVSDPYKGHEHMVKRNLQDVKLIAIKMERRGSKP